MEFKNLNSGFSFILKLRKGSVLIQGTRVSSFEGITNTFGFLTRHMRTLKGRAWFGLGLTTLLTSEFKKDILIDEKIRPFMEHPAYNLFTKPPISSRRDGEEIFTP